MWSDSNATVGFIRQCFFRKFRVAQTQLGPQLLGCTDSTFSVAQTQPIWNEKMCVDLNEYDILNQNAIFWYISTLAMKCFQF